jgi:glycosyltransferase involved in cell wall biosynthesis
MVVHAYYPEGETRVERQAGALIARGYEVDVVCLRRAGQRVVDRHSGVNVYRLAVRRHKGRGVVVQFLEYLVFLILATFKTAALHRRRRYQVVQVHNLPDFLVLAAALPKLGRARVVLDLHDLMPEFYAARFGTSLRSWAARVLVWQEQLSCRFADHVITVTKQWRQTLIDRGLAAEKVTVVMNVADSRVFHRAGLSEPRSAADGEFALLYHGNLTHRYGIDLAIEAVGLVRAQIPGICLTIHGGGDYQAALYQKAEELGLQQHIRFSHRSLPTEELPNLIRQADVGLVPYRRDLFTDGILPTKLMEYVAVGLPVIAARTPTIAAYLNETMVQFFTPGDAPDLARCIVALYHDRERLARLVEQSDEFNRRYNWTLLGAEYVALVERLGAQPARRRRKKHRGSEG